MTKEFKKITNKNETRYVLENASGGASAGGTSAASVNGAGASPTSSLGVLRRRLKELQDKVIRVKGTGTGGQRNTVAQGIIRQGGQSGAGAHQNKRAKATTGSGKGGRDFKKFHGGMDEDRNEETGNTLYLKFKFHRNNWIAYAGYALSPKDLQYKTEIQRSEAIITKLNDLDRFINHLKSQDDFNKRDRIIIVVNSEIYYKERYPEYIMELLQMVQDDLYDNVMLKIIEPVEKDERVKSKYNRPNFQMGGKTAEQKPVVRFTVVDPRMKQQMKDAGIPMEGDAFVMPPEKYQAFLEKLKQATKKDPSMFIKRMNEEDDLDEQSIFYGSDKPAQPWHSIEKILGKSTSMENQDHEISMASSELTSIAKDAAKLLNLIKQRSEEEGLKAWQQSEITKAADSMNSVLQSISGDQDIEDPREYAERSADADAEYYGKVYEELKNQGVAEDTGLSNLTNDQITGITQMLQNGYDIPTIIRIFDNIPTKEQIIQISKERVMSLMKEQGVAEGPESQFVAARYIDEFADGDHWYVKGTPEVIQRFVQLANSLEDEAVKGTHYEPGKGMMAQVHAKLGDDSIPQWQIVKAQNLEGLKPIGNKVLQRLMAPNLSDGVQEFMSDFLWALEEKGLAMVTDEPQQSVAEVRTRLDPKCWSNKKIGNPKTKMKGGVRVNNCVPKEGMAEGDYEYNQYDELRNEIEGILIKAYDYYSTREEIIKAAKPAAQKVAQQMGLEKHFNDIWSNVLAGHDVDTNFGDNDPPKSPGHPTDQRMRGGEGKFRDQYFENLSAKLESVINHNIPEGWENTIKAMKKHPELTKGKTKTGKKKNVFALANWMKSQGYKSHK